MPTIQFESAVRAALDQGRPVVALESTIITHGMPWPDNLAMLERVEEAVRAHGAKRWPGGKTRPNYRAPISPLPAPKS